MSVQIPKTYNLSVNPFPSEIGVPPEIVSFWADRIDVHDRVVRLINSSLVHRKSNLFMLFGTYGQGKTHTLRYLDWYISSKKKQDAIGIYLDNPGASMRDFYRKLVIKIGRDQVLQYANEFSGSIFLAYVKKLINDVENKRVLTRAEFPSHVTNQDLVRSNVRRTLREIAGPEFPEFASVLIQLPDREKEEIAWKWLTAGDMSAAELRVTLQVPMGIETDEDAVKATKALLTILHGVGYAMVFIFADEMESLITRLTDKDRQNYTASLRDIVDLNPEGLCIFMSCSAENERDFKTASDAALISRIPSSNEIMLRNLSENEMKEFIAAFLEQVRVPTSKSKGEIDAEKLRPFTSDSIPEIYRLTQNGNARKVVRICRTLIDEGAALSLDAIDAKAVKLIGSRIKL
jgi:Cdc6-like AAA superfamily ATPase